MAVVPLDGELVVVDDDDLTVTAYHARVNPHAEDTLLTTIEVPGQTFVYIADLYNAGFGLTLVIGGPESAFAQLRSIGVIDADCQSDTALTIVPAHGVPLSLEDSLAELAGLGIDVGC